MKTKAGTGTVDSQNTHTRVRRFAIWVQYHRIVHIEQWLGVSPRIPYFLVFALLLDPAGFV